MERLPDQPESLETVVERSPIASKARKFAGEAHEGQKRDEGSPYFSHCEAVARIVCEELGIKDPVMISAAFLHDVPEDTKITLENIRVEFGDEVADLVDGVTKIRQEIKEENPGRKISKDESDRLNVKKVVTGCRLEPRVGILKAAADRLHNMRTLNYVRKDKQIPKANETLKYAKLLESLGVWVKMKELEDLALMYTDPAAYKKFAELVASDERANPEFVENMKSGLEALIPVGIKADVTFRINSLTRLMHKMQRTPDVKDINDLISFRIIVDENDENVAANNCYQVLRVLQEERASQEDQSRFDNFYFKKTGTGYSAIQMTLNTSYGAVEIAITSKKKEDFNNWGVVSLIRQGQKELSKYSRVLIFTPEGDVKFFPEGATVIDFAYSIAPNFGVRAVKAIVDGIEKEMTYVLKNGENVQVILGPDRIAPNKRWQNPDYCLPETLAIINEQILDQSRHDQIKKGVELASQIIQKRGLIDLVDLYSFESCSENLTNMLYHIGCKGSLDSLYYRIGAGYITPEKLDEHLNAFGISAEQLKFSSILIKGVDQAGILETVGAKIQSLNGNVGALNFDRKNIDKRIIFNLRLVAEGLTEQSKRHLKDSFLQNPYIKEVTIV
jgi:GTP pyrophosphokinase